MNHPIRFPASLFLMEEDIGNDWVPVKHDLFKDGTTEKLIFSVAWNHEHGKVNPCS